MPHQAAEVARYGPLCVACGAGGVADFLLNVVLFLPLGTALRLAGLRTGQALAWGAALSGLVELLQFGVIPGRDATIGDVMANGLGSWVGALTAPFLGQMVRPERRTAGLLAAGWLALGAGATAGAVTLMEPAPPAGPWYGQWAAAGPEPEWFEGRVLRATLGDRPLSHWRLDAWEEYRAGLDRLQAVILGATLETGSAVDSSLFLVAVADEDGNKFATLSQQGGDLRFQVRLRAAELGLRSPSFLLPGAMPASPGELIEVRGSYGNRTAAIGTRSGGGGSQVVRYLSPFDAWRLLLGTAVEGRPLEAILGVGWILGLVGPALWWLAIAAGVAAPSRRRPG